MEGTVRANCPKCQTVLRIPAKWIGQSVKCKKCGQIVSAKTCPHDKEFHIVLSGTQVREMLARGEMLPEEFTRPEVSKVLIEGLRKKVEQDKNG